MKRDDRLFAGSPEILAACDEVGQARLVRGAVIRTGAGMLPALTGSGPQTSTPHLRWSSHRPIALTDGVIAIALTLLVLDLTSIEVHGSSARELWDTLNQQSSRFVAFFIASG
jgi:hypothetical protein